MSAIEALLRSRLAALEPETLEIYDESAEHVGHAGSSGGGHFSIVVVSRQFSGLGRLARHQAVYSRVQDLIPSAVHALSIKALTPEEFR